MTTLSNIDSGALEKLSLKNYFKTIESILKGDNSVDELTRLFTIKQYSETKPYLTRRQLIAADTRFKTIELVYEDTKKVQAIVWNFSISLSQLIDMFGEPIIHNEPYSDSTAFAFKSENPDIAIIKTRYPKWLTKPDGKIGFEYEDKHLKIELLDPVFTFIQFSFNT